MTFEFLISCQMMAYSDIDDIAQFLGDTLREILDYHQIYFDDGMIEMRHKRLVSEASAGNGNTLIGFAVELPQRYCWRGKCNRRLRQRFAV